MQVLLGSRHTSGILNMRREHGLLPLHFSMSETLCKSTLAKNNSVLLNITLLQTTTNKKHEIMAQNEVLRTQTKGNDHKPNEIRKTH